MTASRPFADRDAEREVDLARWRAAIIAMWWLPVAGLFAGAVVGFLFSLGSGSTYKASALISLGQPVSPGGIVTSSFGTNPLAVGQITSSASAQGEAARAAGLHPAALRGHVSIATVGAATGATAAHAAPLISLTVTGKTPVKTEDAANALARDVVAVTTAPYVGTKIATYTQVLQTTNEQLASISRRLAELNNNLKVSHLQPLDELVLVSEIDESEQRQGNLYGQQATTLQQLAFAKNVESAKVITPAKSVQVTARSHRSSALVGSLIGLILGAIAAIIADARSLRLNQA